MILYHGSNCDIAKIDLAMCKPFKDFGQAFYLTTILTQAREMARKVADRFGGEPVVNAFELEDDNLFGMKSRKLNNQYAFLTDRAVSLLKKRPSV
ncbi:DUF3990 domain-containing protein [uncultured Fibrobacter sp.]|uniref:DUF3990 domain-containing protein n=1 Tax=uncultured Fibrobacter sp. TaxID=261512 RepID=UPI0026340430|nr:DUF3990 domain-containing protein [uncultured Fibrobacter sp.]